MLTFLQFEGEAAAPPLLLLASLLVVEGMRIS
jgi:hypothetical protein